MKTSKKVEGEKSIKNYIEINKNNVLEKSVYLVQIVVYFHFSFKVQLYKLVSFHDCMPD